MQHATFSAQRSKVAASATSPLTNNPFLSRCADIGTDSVVDTNNEMQAGLRDQVVFRLGVDGSILFVNEAGERLTGYSAVELARLNVLDLLPGLCADDLRAMVQPSIGQRFGTVFEIEVTSRDRRKVLLEVSLDLIRGPDRKLEFSGIAVPKSAAPDFWRPRCLDRRFQFKAPKQLNAVLPVAW